MVDKPEAPENLIQQMDLVADALGPEFNVTYRTYNGGAVVYVEHLDLQSAHSFCIHGTGWKAMLELSAKVIVTSA